MLNNIKIDENHYYYTNKSKTVLNIKDEKLVFLIKNIGDKVYLLVGEKENFEGGDFFNEELLRNYFITFIPIILNKLTQKKIIINGEDRNIFLEKDVELKEITLNTEKLKPPLIINIK